MRAAAPGLVAVLVGSHEDAAARARLGVSDRLLTAEEVAEMLSVPLRFVREHTRTGAIPHLRIGQRYVRYRRESVLFWLDSLETGGRAVTPRKYAPTVRSGGTK